MTKKEQQIFELLPKEARSVVLSDTQKRQDVKKIVRKIYKEHNKDLRALAKH